MPKKRLSHFTWPLGAVHNICLLHLASDAKWRLPFLLSHFLRGVFFSVSTLVRLFSILFYSFFSAFSFFSRLRWSGPRGNILAVNFPVLNISFGKHWLFHTNAPIFTRWRTRSGSRLDCTNFYPELQFEMHILSHANERWNDDDGIVCSAMPAHSPSDKERTQTKARNETHRLNVCCRARAGSHAHQTHSLHIKYASSSAVYLTSSAIKMLILHCIQLLAAYAFFYFSSYRSLSLSLSLTSISECIRTCVAVDVNLCVSLCLPSSLWS